MLGQAQDFGEVGVAIAWVAALVLAFGPGARGITYIVDRIRDVFDKDDSWPTVVPGVIALVIALGVCLGFEINIAGGLLAQVPRFAGTGLDETAGQVITAVGLAGFASSWHDRDKAKNPPSLPKTGH